MNFRIMLQTVFIDLFPSIIETFINKIMSQIYNSLNIFQFPNIVLKSHEE